MLKNVYCAMFTLAVLVCIASASLVVHHENKRSVATLDRVFENLEKLETLMNNLGNKINRISQNQAYVTATLSQTLKFWDAHFCMKGFVRNDLSCYLPVTKKLNWDDAEQYCQKYGAHLLSVESFEEHLFLKQLLLKRQIQDTNLWSGGRFVNATHRNWIWQHDNEELKAWIIASGAQNTSYPVRLVNGDSANSGRVEIHVPGHGGWGIVCDDDWDINDANVVCRQLGFQGATSFPGESTYGHGNGQHRMDDLACTGTETSLDKCGHCGWNVDDCGDTEAAGVVCQEQSGMLGITIHNDMIPQDSDHDCLAMDKTNGHYRAYNCQSSLSFICKM